MSLKANRAYNSLRQNFNFYNNTSVKVMVKLYEAMVQPISCCGSELWGVDGWRKNETKCFLTHLLSDNHNFEKIHTKMCKQSLGMNISTPGKLAKAELGRYPIICFIFKLCYGFWQHILSAESTTLTHDRVATRQTKRNSLTFHKKSGNPAWSTKSQY